ncbi:vomeronasal type-2 receptor 26-like [Xenopus tropicalis]|uniref:Vomeronasal type-2 receptor 26-like n=1 Tax=Xenopus tropicalis TaxID=8364 RepID=A0A8J1JL90_XENTR|nr:vomeronasal type-2 receptor 26-like [Xenopus tropicalis]
MKPGDWVIAALLQLNDYFESDSNMSDSWVVCVPISLQYYRHYLAFIFAVEEINRSSWILPNITLGYQIFDSCGSTTKSLSGALSAISGKQQNVPNFSCWGNSKVVGFVGDLSADTTYTIAQLVGVLSYPQINQFVRNVTFTTFPNDTHSFNKYGDPPAQFNIIKLLFLPGDRSVITKVGNFNVSDHGTQFYINNSADLWGPHFNMTPQSLCNEPCAPGYRKSKIEGAPSCCHDCVPCIDGEMSNTSDSSTCFRCPGYEMSNKQRTACVPKMINYLSYEETLGASLASIALVLFLTTSAVQGVFVKYWETPIVRANNQHLSCLLLISLMLCFLCTLLFIGRPTQICCLLRQVTFGIVFTISVSSVLAKTLTVIIAFNATKPGSKLKKCIGSQVPIVFVTICSLGKIGICIVWMAFDPPFLKADMFSERNTIILQCNEGSVTFFFCIIGYIGTLALLSFIVAFLAKDFPDRFNEAKNITFSMLGFCSVWGAFVPAYLSSKGSRMVAVEIFAILSSSAGLLGCIFAPKCYIIFLRPELNTKIAQWIFPPKKPFVRKKVGEFYASESDENDFYIINSSELWTPYFSKFPQSLCNEPCPPGYRKSKIQGAQSCCHDCVRCLEGGNVQHNRCGLL